MARAKNGSNGHLEAALESLAQAQRVLSENLSTLSQGQISLGQAQAALNQAQATSVQTHVDFVAQMAETRKQYAEMDRANTERFARIEGLLREYNRILQSLPEAVRDKIGFK